MSNQSEGKLKINFGYLKTLINAIEAIQSPSFTHAEILHNLDVGVTKHTAENCNIELYGNRWLIGNLTIDIKDKQHEDNYVFHMSLLKEEKIIVMIKESYSLGITKEKDQCLFDYAYEMRLSSKGHDLSCALNTDGFLHKLESLQGSIGLAGVISLARTMQQEVASKILTNRNVRSEQVSLNPEPRQFKLQTKPPGYGRRVCESPLKGNARQAPKTLGGHAKSSSHGIKKVRNASNGSIVRGNCSKNTQLNKNQKRR